MSANVSPEMIAEAARAIRDADAILIGAGAGMGVDSGMPDFRGNEGFWVAYPPLKELGLSFVQIANPSWFERDPHLAWGFYGHRLNLYRATTPHAGFGLLKELCTHKSTFIFTSNVDGHFQKAGFSSLDIEECHGSIHHLQCVNGMCSQLNRLIWSGEETIIDVDPATFRAKNPLPTCPLCGGLARPNVLMFNDPIWLDERSTEQEKRHHAWENEIEGKVVIIECGAGTAVPSVRHHCEALARYRNGTLIRINVRESQGPQGTLSFPMGALAAISAIAEASQAL
jgi:NAD-dependent SIR2 family protein deacetylase